jgi:hypothetical protein
MAYLSCGADRRLTRPDLQGALLDVVSVEVSVIPPALGPEPGDCMPTGSGPGPVFLATVWPSAKAQALL